MSYRLSSCWASLGRTFASCLAFARSCPRMRPSRRMRKLWRAGARGQAAPWAASPVLSEASTPLVLDCLPAKDGESLKGFRFSTMGNSCSSRFLSGQSAESAFRSIQAWVLACWALLKTHQVQEPPFDFTGHCPCTQPMSCQCKPRLMQFPRKPSPEDPNHY